MLGHRLKIEFKIVNPENEREIIDFEAVVDKLGFCPEENTTRVYKENNKDFAFQNNVLAVVVGLSVSILVAALVTLLILCYRKRRASKQARKQGRVDQNPVYGHSEDYYVGGGRMQVEDTSPYYGVREENWEDFVTDNNTYYD